MKNSYFFIVISFTFFIGAPSLHAQKTKAHEPLVHTYSIVARDARTGEMAVGVQSHWFSVGTLVCWGKSGVGVVATQSFVNPSYGPQGIKEMENGKNAREALENLITKDEGRDFRQVAFLDKNGNAHAYTGAKCIAYAHHEQGENFSVQANMMLNNTVVPAMAKTFKENKDLPLAERVITALLVAQKHGGDIRGKQSAALIVVGPDPVDEVWQDKKIDLRVDDHTRPLEELSRLLRVHRAYDHMNQGDLAIEHGNMASALIEYGAAEKMFPENLEMQYWKGVALANNNRLKEAIPIFKKIFSKDENWKELTKRLPASGLLNLKKEELNQIIRL